MSKKFFNKKRMKKINKTLSSPNVRYLGGGILSLAAIGGLKVLTEKYPQLKEYFIPEESNRVTDYSSENEVQI